MRMLFVGMKDHCGWMYEYSKLINQYTDNVSNCILYKDIGGYGADIILKEYGQQSEKMLTSDKIDLACEFARETDCFVFNGCDIGVHKFKYGRVDFNKYVRSRPFIFFLGGELYSREQLFVQWGTIPAITNQPLTYRSLASQGDLDVRMVRPMLDMTPTTTITEKNKKLNSFLYRDEENSKKIYNLDTFLMIFSFLYNEIGQIDYTSTLGVGYETVKEIFQEYCYSVDILSPTGLYTRSSIESVMNGIVNFTSLSPLDIEVMDKICQGTCDVFDCVNNERDLYETAKKYILSQEAYQKRSWQIRTDSQALFHGKHITEFMNTFENILEDHA